MAKSRGYSGGGDEGVDVARLIEVSNKEQKNLNGVLSFVLYPFRDSAKYANKLLDKEIERVVKLGKAEEKKATAEQIIEQAKKKYYEKLDKQVTQDLENAKNAKNALEEKQKRDKEDYEHKKRINGETLKILELEKSKLKGAGKDTTEQDKKIADFKKELAQNEREFKKQQKESDVKIAEQKKIIAEYEDEIKAGLHKALVNNSRLKQLVDDKYITEASGYDGGRAKTLAEREVKAEQAELDTIQATNLAYDRGEIVAKMSGRSSMDLDFGTDDDERPAKGKIAPKPAQQQHQIKVDTSLGELDPLAQLNQAISTPIQSIDLMQRNLNENQREEDIAHRTERESLTDIYRKMVEDNLTEQTYQLKTINENQHQIYALLEQGNIGQGGGGGFNPLDLLGLGGGKAGGAIRAIGGGVRAVASKLPLLALAYGGVKGIGAGMDTDTIAARRGIDPSEVGVLDRIGYGASGLLSGITGGLIGTDTIANAGESIGNFLFGKSDKDIVKDARTQEAQDLAEMEAILASRGVVSTATSTDASQSIHNQILNQMGVEAQKKGQELAELNEGTGGGFSNANVSNITNNTTNVIPEAPRFRINDQATMALSAQGL